MSTYQQSDNNLKREELFRQAIEGWVEGNRAEIISRQALADMEGMERVLALRNGIIANIIAYCHMNPRADTTMAVLVIVTLLSDNANGYCYISAGRLAEVLSRSRQNIQSTLTSLVANGALIAEHVAGNTTRYTPAIHRIFAEKASALWFVTSLSEAPKEAGRPRHEKGVNSCGHLLNGVAKKVSPVASKGVTSCTEKVSTTVDTISLREITKESPNGDREIKSPKVANLISENISIRTETTPPVKARRGRPPKQLKLPGVSTDADAESAAENAEQALDDEGVALFNEAARKIGILPVVVFTSARSRDLRQLRYSLGKKGVDWRLVFENLGKSKFPTRNGFCLEDFDHVMKYYARLAEGPFVEAKKAPSKAMQSANEQISFVDKAREAEMIPHVRIQAFIERKCWSSLWGPRPGEHGCEIPQDVIDQYPQLNAIIAGTAAMKQKEVSE
jgi:hypothetical protein